MPAGACRILASSRGGLFGRARACRLLAGLAHPDGFGTSELARDLLLNRRGNPLATATARNWATITKLAALCDS
jgi:hypothetical protein